MARLSTHVLDMSRGKPAAGMMILLFLDKPAGRELLHTVRTNADGRTDEPLLSGERIETGTYELVFSAGAYFRELGETLPSPAFLDEIVIRFGVADDRGNYHVPLLVAPYGYSTYRGS
jgi:5-hydroxyisourate hydrolase